MDYFLFNFLGVQFHYTMSHIFSALSLAKAPVCFITFHANKKAYILALRMYASFLICQLKASKFFIFSE